ncbi:hypothetical protein ACRAWF_09485 [Streptomyces sp. L7]
MTQTPGLLTSTSQLLDEAIRKDFPILDRTVHDGEKLVRTWTTRRPRRSRARCWTP